MKQEISKFYSEIVMPYHNVSIKISIIKFNIETKGTRGYGKVIKG